MLIVAGKRRGGGGEKRQKIDNAPQSEQVPDVVHPGRDIEGLKEVGQIRVGVAEGRELPVEDADYARFGGVEDLLETDG